MTEIGNAVSRGTVQVFHALGIEQGSALPAHDRQRLFGIHARGVFVFDFDDFICVHWITVPFPARAFEMGFWIRPSAMITRLTPPRSASSAPSTFFFMRPCAASL